MADYALIDGYLDSLRVSVRWRRDVDDVVAEMRDHLYSAVERLDGRGTDVHLAQRQTLDRFGDPSLVARSLASTPTGGLAMPTNDTRFAGLMGMWAGALMLLLPIGWTLSMIAEERSGDWGGVERAFFITGAFALLGSAALGLLLLIGLTKRHGGFGVPGYVGLGLVALGIPASLIAWWIFGWGMLYGAGLAVFGVLMLGRQISPRVPTFALGFGMLAGVGAFVLLDAIEIGFRDSYGDYPVALAIGAWVMCGVTAYGFYSIGSWLRSEEPVDVDQNEALTAA